MEIVKKTIGFAVILIAVFGASLSVASAAGKSSRKHARCQNYRAPVQEAA